MKKTTDRVNMTDPIVSDNTKKAVAFLKTLFKEKRINVVAIDPNSFNVVAITRPVDSAAIAQFIDTYNGRRNIYYSVNTPRDDAPDNKLKKEHIAEINAVWLDADPLPYRPSASAVENEETAKAKHFKEERKRLHAFAKELAASDNPPTVITDSGGGIQAFWFLDKPVPVTEASRKEYEALSRGLACKYDTDTVQNIDRIMRVPYTWNLPGAKKAGRDKALARSTKIDTKRYSKLDFITPVEADDTITEIDYSKLTLQQVKQPLTGDLLTKFEDLRKRNNKVDDLWTLENDFKEGDRSDRDFTLAKELKGEGFTLIDTAIIMWNYPHGKVTSVKNPVREIIRCYERSGNDFAAPIDAAHLAAIEKQVNPLKAAKEKVLKLLSTAAYISAGAATRQGSGTPLFKHFMNMDTVNVLFGPSGSGKSFLTLDMALHLAAGKDWCGFKCKKKMAVLYVCTESGSSFGKRLEAARERVGGKAGTPLSELPFAYYPAYVDLLTNKDHLTLIKKLIADLEAESGYKCGLVVIDTLSAAFGGGNENSEDMTKFVNNMAEIKFSRKVSVLIVHHTGKDESAGARGHSSLKGNIDTEIQVKAEKRGEKWYRSFSSTKQKDDETGNMKRFGLSIVELGKDEDGDAITTCRVILENDTEFEAMAPSIEDELDSEGSAAYRAIKFYDAAIKTSEHEFEHTEREAKAVIYNAIMKGTGMFDFNNPSLEPLHVMSRPPKDSAIIKAFTRGCGKLAERNLVKDTVRYQLIENEENS